MKWCYNYLWLYVFACCFGSVPGEDPSGQSMILPRHEFYRIVMEAQVKTKEQREAEEAAIKRQKEEMMVKIHSSSIFLFGGGGDYTSAQ